MHTKKGAEHCRTTPALRLPGDCGPWGRWGTDKHGELAVVEGAQRPEQPTAGRDLIPFYARSAALNGRKSLTGALGAEGRVLQWSCHKWSS